MVFRCCVSNCSSTSKEKDIYFFKIPQKEAVRQAWIEAIGLSAYQSCRLWSQVVCSLHFEKEDYFTFSTRHNLKNNVVPSLCLRGNPSTIKSPEERDQVYPISEESPLIMETTKRKCSDSVSPTDTCSKKHKKRFFFGPILFIPEKT